MSISLLITGETILCARLLLQCSVASTLFIFILPVYLGS